MKKKLLLLLTVLGIGTASFAQEGFHAGIQYTYFMTGIIHGPSTAGLVRDTANANNNNKTNNPFTKFQPKWGSAIGLAVGYGFIPMVGVQLEANIATQGQRATGSGEHGQDISRDIELKYIQVPLLFKFRTPGAVAHYYILLGPQFDFLSSAVINDSRYPNGIDPTTGHPIDAKAHFQQTDIGVAFGTGLELGIPKLYFNVGLRMYYGISDPVSGDWKLPDRRNAYQESHNAYGGVNIGAHYKF